MKFRVEIDRAGRRPQGPTARRSFVVELPALGPSVEAAARVDGRTFAVKLLPEVEGESVLLVDGRRYPLHELPGRELPGPGGEVDGVLVRFLHGGLPVTARVESEVDRLRAEVRDAPRGDAPYLVTSPLPGVVRRVFAQAGAVVEANAPLFTLEAMKMENEVRAGRRSRLLEVFVAPGQVVNAGDRLARLGPA